VVVATPTADGDLDPTHVGVYVGDAALPPCPANANDVPQTAAMAALLNLAAARDMLSRAYFCEPTAWVVGGGNGHRGSVTRVLLPPWVVDVARDVKRSSGGGPPPLATQGLATQ
jgi:hypothetical protein